VRVQHRHRDLRGAGEPDAFMLRPALHQLAAELRAGQRAGGEQPPGLGGEFVGVDADGHPAEEALPHPVEHRLQQRADPQVVTIGEQMLGAPVQRAADHPAPLDQRGQIVEPEAGDPVPQPDVGQFRILPLHPDQQFDDVERPVGAAFEKKLPLQRGPAQCPFGEDDHVVILSDIAATF
jgi:hypothetical protein